MDRLVRYGVPVLGVFTIGQGFLIFVLGIWAWSLSSDVENLTKETDWLRAQAASAHHRLQSLEGR
jgi:hypothetical protein